MSRILGIDYGSKRIGLAMAEEGSLAFPLSVVLNDKNLFDNFTKIIEKNEVSKVILGESKDYSMKDNLIMGEINKFKQNLEEKFKLEVIFQPEFMTSMQAERIQGKNKMIDASAATIILQSYLDSCQ
jgi:putative Holliday junction resolvase